MPDGTLIDAWGGGMLNRILMTSHLVGNIQVNMIECVNERLSRSSKGSASKNCTYVRHTHLPIKNNNELMLMIQGFPYKTTVFQNLQKYS